MAGAGYSTAEVKTRKRAKTNKVKTGCKTCKLRRVKCDETKPACDRCRKFGRKCDGYEADMPKEDPVKTLQVTKFRPLLKKAFPVITQPSDQVFHTGEEFRCFQLYCEDTASRLSGVAGGSLWPRLLLQASHDQPCIRHAIFTIGALSKMLKSGGLGQFKFKMQTKTSDDIVLKKYYDFALWHYDKFLQGTRARILNGEQGHRMAFIACLLVICIESLQNHTEVALQHAKAGTELMHKWLASTPALVSDGDIIEWSGSLKLLPGISSPAPHVVEDELVQQFNRLHLQTLAVFDIQEPEQHSRLKREGSSTIRVMPSVFTNAHDARLFLELIIRRSYNFMSERIDGKNIKIGKINDIVRFTDQELYSKRTPRGISHIPVNIQDQLQIEQEIYLSENRRWSQAFGPLFRSTQLDTSHPEMLLAILLKIRSIALNISLAGHISDNELVYDEFLPDFQQIVTLAKSLYEHVENQQLFEDGSYIFDMGLIYDLCLVPISCRDRSLRREALALLNSRNFKEGTLGSRTSADLATCLMELEEAVETDYIPESARVRLTGCDIVVEKRTATVHCLQGVGKDAVFRSCVRDWSSMF